MLKVVTDGGMNGYPPVGVGMLKLPVKRPGWAASAAKVPVKGPTVFADVL